MRERRRWLALLIVTSTAAMVSGGVALGQSVAPSPSGSRAGLDEPPSVQPEFAQRLGVAKEAWGRKRWPKAPKLPQRQSDVSRPSRAELQASHERWAGRQGPATVRRLVGRAAPALVDPQPTVPPVADVDQVLSGTALALKSGKEGPGGAVISNSPLAVPLDPPAVGGTPDERVAKDADRRWRVADARWRKRADGSLRIRRGLAPIVAPERAGEAFRIGRFRLRLAPEDSQARPVLDEESSELVTFPSVDASSASGEGSSDLTVRGQPDGVRWAVLVREPSASRVHEVALEDLPEGYRLRVVPGSRGEVVLLDDADGVAAQVSAPIAVDADGESVPVTTKVVDGDRIRYRIDRELSEVKLPLTLDPAVSWDPVSLSYNWSGGATNRFAGWRRAIWRGSPPWSVQPQMGLGAQSGLYVAGANAVYGLTGYLPYDYGAWVVGSVACGGDAGAGVQRSSDVSAGAQDALRACVLVRPRDGVLVRHHPVPDLSRVR